MNAELWPPGHLQMAAIIIIMGWEEMRTPATCADHGSEARRIVLVAPTHGVTLTHIEGGVLVAIHGLVS